MERRQFLRMALGIGAGPLLIPDTVRGAGSRPAPSNRITVGLIGTGSHGVGVNLKSLLGQPDAQVIALCDVDGERLRSAAELTGKHYGAGRADGRFGGLFLTGDWRELVGRGDLDAVCVATPDHWHVLPSLAAVRAGKDVICEKPLTLTVAEGRALSDAVRRYGRVFQTASENRSMQSFVRLCELVRNGCIGRLQTIRVGLPKGPASVGQCYPEEPVPPHFDYDMWLGPAPRAPYTKARCHYQFRWIRDYSGGHLTDWGAHLLDVAQWGNDTEYSGPVSVEGRGVFPREGLYNTAGEFHLTYGYANGVTLICASTGPSIRFEGSGGWVGVPSWGGAVQASAAEILRAPLGSTAVRLRTCPGREHRDFLDCVKTRQLTYAPAEVGHRTATLCHIGNIAMLLGRRLSWDPVRERFRDDPEADAMLSRAMRPPWSLLG
ncbi:MAG: Gfo/Idh/MocA family oxidoreductase [Lentisphaeria bacterium]|nr:Gfo/Idh/MocA family oxidoreductase [Lentisphaeria bacterium]